MRSRPLFIHLIKAIRKTNYAARILKFAQRQTAAGLHSTRPALNRLYLHENKRDTWKESAHTAPALAGDAIVCVSLLETRLGSSRFGMREGKRHLQEPFPSTYTWRFRGHRPPQPSRSGSGSGSSPRRRLAIAPRDRDATTYSSGPPRRGEAPGAHCGSPSSRAGGAGRCPAGRGLSVLGAVTVTGRALPSRSPEPPQTFNVSEEASHRSERRSRGWRGDVPWPPAPERGAVAGSGSGSIPLLHRPNNAPAHPRGCLVLNPAALLPILFIYLFIFKLGHLHKLKDVCCNRINFSLGKGLISQRKAPSPRPRSGSKDNEVKSRNKHLDIPANKKKPCESEVLF